MYCIIGQGCGDSFLFYFFVLLLPYYKPLRSRH